MKRLIICLAAFYAASTGLAQDKAQLKDQKDKASYSIGHDIGTTFKKQNIEVNLDALVAGLKDAISGRAPALTKEERDKTLEVFQKEMMEKQVAASKEAATKNAAEGEKFLAENKKKDGIKTTASGLQYKVLKEGTGPMPKDTDTVMTNYKGTLIDGTEFDSSEKHGGPATFRVTGVIKGWTEALQLMKTGSKYQIFVPSNLAYGEKARSQEIGPNSTLIFELELLSIVPPESTAVPPSAQGTPAAIAPAKQNPSTPAATSPAAKPSPSVAVKPVAKPSPSASPK
ncbi:MAG: FKBP-type peptidyl-prolyl cis-trans isomerase FklB [Verrucomicrobiota bacterium]